MMEKPEAIVEQLFEEALDLPREQRRAFLDGACRSMPEVRHSVEVLLQENDRLSGFLADSPYAPLNGDSGSTARWSYSFPEGTRLGRYCIIEPLGSGGMGVVYRARDEKLERTVAIKMLAPGMLTGDESRRHFRREALALAKLNHPHTAAVYDVGEQNGMDYIVMECVQGQSLAARLQAGPLSIREATVIALEVAEALEEAHEQGVIHRDLKPANVMITPKGHAKVLDFGLAKLLAPRGADATQSLSETGGVMGTPMYMSPEQTLGTSLDARTDLWSLGILYYEALTGRTPFQKSSGLAVLRAISDDPIPPVRGIRADIPEQAEKILARALEKDRELRYQTAAEMVRDLSDLSGRLSGAVIVQAAPEKKISGRTVALVAALLLVAAVAGIWLYSLGSERRWARDKAIPQMDSLIAARKSLAAFLILEKAEKALPGDSQLKQFADANTETIDIASDPAGAQVEVQDYLTPDSVWRVLGKTPLNGVRIPRGYFRWKVSKAGVGEMIGAPETKGKMEFPLAEAAKAPAEMSYVPGTGVDWTTFSAFIGWLGPYTLPAYYVDQHEVTNREYQKFVDSGGYQKPQYWPSQFNRDGKTLSWSDGVALFRDTTGRPGPSTWVAGQYPEGSADFPVSGVSWFEAAAYAKFVGKSLPVLGQWFRTAPADVAQYIVPVSNITANAPAPVGSFKGIGPYGTYDTAGNVREWIANTVDDDVRFILGGSWKSPAYLYTDPEALPPYDRSDANGFRCVRNLSPMPEKAVAPFHRVARDFTTYKPVNDDVFRAYELLYAYQNTPLNAKVEGVVKETADWREEKVSFDTAYNGERMSAYLFLPKRVRPPYQTMIFFPSARVEFLPPDSKELGDIKFFDYIVQSGRAVVYPVYQDLYERRVKYTLPGGSQNIAITTEWYKDAARTLDYLRTRQDIDSGRLGYLGVSMGSANGVIIATLMQDRLKTAIFLDGGYFLSAPPPGGDQADFAPHMKKPVLMVNGRYDYTFPVVKAQDPLFEMLGTPPADKSHVILDTPHDVTEQRPQLVKTVLDWLDHYLGRVQE
jgi:serine/threonine protein kinase/dienelactone hydrolase